MLWYNNKPVKFLVHNYYYVGAPSASQKMFLQTSNTFVPLLQSITHTMYFSVYLRIVCILQSCRTPTPMMSISATPTPSIDKGTLLCKYCSYLSMS